MHHRETSRREAHRTPAAVLAAVGGPAHGLDAVAWAAAEASARHAPLHLLHVIPSDPFGPDSVGPGDAGAYDAARLFVDKAAEHARRVAPHLSIATRITTGDPARTIALEADNADLVVLGREAICRQSHRWSRSLTVQVTARSPRPVAVVGFAGPPGNGRAAGRVIAVAPSCLAPNAAWAVLGTAFNAAHQRGVGITVLVDAPGTTRRSGTNVDDLLAAHLHAFADIDMQRQRLTGPRGSLLTQASQAAALVVLPLPETRVARWRSRSAIRRLLETVTATVTFVHAQGGPLLAHRSSPVGGTR
ncbi:universal stress protein [Kribbella shirazensis]|uniref:Nucleotide-binding universal stress UspA family protein n=1 Tax=Kribbella shirazensis TaxID=1105143 RepID=A0A7X6A4D4_9ACTN|nr:universal stress protein [Kribbella shirazensis]NIK61382.1 nucleotide-binding universal stress UspA family protein [Kribbella shirazensis]